MSEREYFIPEAKTKAQILETIQDILDNKFKRFPNRPDEEFHGLNCSDLELARIWCWQNFDTSGYTAQSVLELYEFIQETFVDGLPLGPTPFRFCKTLEEVKAQHHRTKEILGENLEAFSRGEIVEINKIGDYEIKMHPYDCEFGRGLICLSMWRQERKMFQVSFYPSNPIKVYEVKGSQPSDDEKENTKRKRDTHRFRSKYKLAPSSALVVECMKIAQGLGIEVDVAGHASTWRNYGIENDPKRKAQADSVHSTVRQELGLEYDEQTEAIKKTAEKINSIYSNYFNTALNEDAVIENRFFKLIFLSIEQYQSLFAGREDEFVTKLLFSRYTHEHISFNLPIHVRRWIIQAFKIPNSGSNNEGKRDPNAIWLNFNLPLFMHVNAEQRDKIILEHTLQ